MSNLEPNLLIFFGTFSVMIYSNNPFEMLSSRIGQKRSTKSNSNFSPKKLLMGQAPMSNLDQTVPNLCNLISYDPLYQYL